MKRDKRYATPCHLSQTWYRRHTFNLPTQTCTVAKLIRVNADFRLTIPVKIREASSIRVGDELEISVVPEGILLRRKRIAPPIESGRTILDFLGELHGAGQTKAQLDARLSADRNQW